MSIAFRAILVADDINRKAVLYLRHRKQQRMLNMNQDQINELKRIKMYFPYRIVFGAISPDGKFDAYCKTTMHTANNLVRKGYQVFILE